MGEKIFNPFPTKKKFLFPFKSVGGGGKDRKKNKLFCGSFKLKWLRCQLLSSRGLREIWRAPDPWEPLPRLSTTMQRWEQIILFFTFVRDVLNNLTPFLIYLKFWIQISEKLVHSLLQPIKSPRSPDVPTKAYFFGGGGRISRFKIMGVEEYQVTGNLYCQGFQQPYIALFNRVYRKYLK